jgi:hypothetical protein
MQLGMVGLGRMGRTWSGACYGRSMPAWPMTVKKKPFRPQHVTALPPLHRGLSCCETDSTASDLDDAAGSGGGQ